MRILTELDHCWASTPYRHRLALLLLSVSLVLPVENVRAGWTVNPFCNPLFWLCATLDTEGQFGECVFESPISKVKLVSYEGGVSTYEFSGSAYYRTVGTAACPPEKQAVRGVATWDSHHGLAGTAKETISLEFEFAGWQEVVTTVSECSSNPWLSEGAKCEISSVMPASSSYPKPAPRSASILTAKMRQELIAAEFLVVPPVLQSPTLGQEFDNGKVISSVHKFVPDEQLGKNPAIELHFASPVWPGMPGGQTVDAVAPLNNNYAFKVTPLDGGSWLVKARVTAGAAHGPWGQDVSFKVSGSEAFHLEMEKRDFQIYRKYPEFEVK